MISLCKTAKAFLLHQMDQTRNSRNKSLLIQLNDVERIRRRNITQLIGVYQSINILIHSSTDVNLACLSSNEQHLKGKKKNSPLGEEWRRSSTYRDAINNSSLLSFCDSLRLSQVLTTISILILYLKSEVIILDLLVLGIRNSDFDFFVFPVFAYNLLCGIYRNHVGRFDQWIGWSWWRDHCSASHLSSSNCTILSPPDFFA